MSTMSIPEEQAPGEQRTENRSLIPLRVYEFVEFLSRQCHYPELLTLIEFGNYLSGEETLSGWVLLFDVEEKMKALASTSRPRSKILVGTQI